MPTLDAYFDQPTPELIYLAQLAADDPDVIVRADDILNGSGRPVGTRYTVTDETVQIIREAIAASLDTRTVDEVAFDLDEERFGPQEGGYPDDEDDDA